MQLLGCRAWEFTKSSLIQELVINQGNFFINIIQNGWLIFHARKYIIDCLGTRTFIVLRHFASKLETTSFSPSLTGSYACALNHVFRTDPHSCFKDNFLLLHDFGDGVPKVFCFVLLCFQKQQCYIAAGVHPFWFRIFLL